MKNTPYLSSWIKRFLLKYLISIRNLSKNTQKSYRDIFRLMLPFMAARSKKSIEQLLVEDIGSNAVKAFLSSLEINRHCFLSTRNQRLAAIHAFANFVGLNKPEYVEWCRQLQMLPFKKNQTYINNLS